jgi:hypothetical protein
VLVLRLKSMAARTLRTCIILQLGGWVNLKDHAHLNLTSFGRYLIVIRLFRLSLEPVCRKAGDIDIRPLENQLSFARPFVQQNPRGV